VAEPRLGASGIRIMRLEKEIGDLKQRVEDAEKIDPAKFINELENRVTLIEPTICPKNRVQCGPDSRECISTLLMCDGYNDCNNGWDEDQEHVCTDGPIVPGNVFSGHASWESCANAKDHAVSLTIVGVRKAKYFGARYFVRGQVSADFVEVGTKKYDVKGYYVLGKKTLVLVPLKRTSADAALLCQFNHGDDERADCQLGHQATLNVCARAVLTLQQN